MTLYQVKEVIFIWLPQLPLSRQISSSSSAFPWRTARNDPSNIGRKTVYTTGCSVLSLVNCGPSVPSTIKNCLEGDITAWRAHPLRHPPHLEPESAHEPLVPATQPLRDFSFSFLVLFFFLVNQVLFFLHSIFVICIPNTCFFREKASFK